MTINYDLTGKLEYELASTTYFLRDTTYTDKVSYQIDVVQTEYDDFIAFLNKNTAGNFELHEADVKKLPLIYPLIKNLVCITLPNHLSSYYKQGFIFIMLINTIITVMLFILFVIKLSIGR